MNGTKLARIRRCHTCEHRVTQHADTAGDSKFTVYCIAGGDWAKRLTLDDAHMEGPAGNCPIDRWPGLAPVDIAAEREQNRADAILREVARWKDTIDDMLPGKYSEVEIRERLTKMVEAGRMMEEVATALEEYVLARD